MTKGAFHFYQNFGRQGYLDGVFVADHQDVLNAYGRQVYFGEVLGKHSEIYCELTEDNLRLITNEPSDVEVFERYDVNVGYNPLDYLDEDNDEAVFDEFVDGFDSL